MRLDLLSLRGSHSHRKSIRNSWTLALSDLLPVSNGEWVLGAAPAKEVISVPRPDHTSNTFYIMVLVLLRYTFAF